MTTVQAAAGDSSTEQLKPRSPERPAEFVPTPERLSQYLERNTADVETRLSSVDGRKEIYNELVTHEADLKQAYPGFRSADLQRQLDLVGDTLRKKKSYLEEQQLPEKKNMFKRAFERVKTFAKKHPVVTTLIVVGLAAAAVAGGMYLAGGMETLMATAGLKKVVAGAQAVSENLTGVTSVADKLPGAGYLEIPVKAAASGLDIVP